MNQPHERAGPASLVLAPQRPAGEPYTTSEIIAEGTGINHRRVRDAIRKYQTDLETFGRVVAYQTPLETKGGVQAVPGYILNEQQATFLLTLLKNTPVVVAFKKELVRQFYAMRSLLLERASPIWQDARSLGKEIRRQEVEAIKQLVDYATAQGSRRAGWYYANLSKLADSTVGIHHLKHLHAPGFQFQSRLGKCDPGCLSDCGLRHCPPMSLLKLPQNRRKSA